MPSSDSNPDRDISGMPLTQIQEHILTTIIREGETKYSYVSLETILEDAENKPEFERQIGQLVIKGFLKIKTDDDGEENYYLTDKSLNVILDK